jgi:cell division septum initiation protein DivIVA
MSVFGMAISELLLTQREVETLKSIDHEQLKHNAIKESDLIIREANVTADKIVFEAKKKSLDL